MSVDRPKQFSRRDVLRFVGGLITLTGVNAVCRISGGISPTKGKGNPTPTLNSRVNYDPNQVYPGEMPYNNLHEKLEGKEVFEEGTAQLLRDFDNPDAVDTNSFLRKIKAPYVARPDQVGLGHTDSSIRARQYSYDVLKSAGKIEVADLFDVQTKPALRFTSEIIGSENDRDASAALIALVVTYAMNPGLFKEGMTVEDALKNPQILSRVSFYQNQILSLTQERGLEISEAEKQRRKDANSQDASRLLGGLAQKLQNPDQYVSCNDFNKDAKTREDQKLSNRQVTHKSGESDTFTTSNSDEHFVGFYMTFDYATKTFKVYAFNDRGYTGGTKQDLKNQEDSAVFEQEKPCAETQPKKVIQKTKVPVQQGQPGQPNQPTSQPPEWPTPAPTNVHRETLPTATQGSAPTEIPPTTQATQIP